MGEQLPFSHTMIGQEQDSNSPIIFLQACSSIGDGGMTGIGSAENLTGIRPKILS